MAARLARDTSSKAVPVAAPEGAPAASPAAAAEASSPWVSGDADAAARDGARALQDQLKADLYTGRLEQTDKPAPYAPARGLLIAAIPSALIWWGVASLVHALTRH